MSTSTKAQPTDAAPDDDVVLPAVTDTGVGDPDVDSLVGTDGVFTLESGMAVRMRPLRTREIFALFRIVAIGLGARIAGIRLDPDEDDSVFLGKFAGMLLTSMLDETAEDKAMAFLRLIIEPANLVVDGALSKADETRNTAAKAALDAEMVNPEPLDTITIVQVLAMREAGDLQALGKRLAGAWKMFSRTGLIPPSR
jgi:hypothetical protein